ncbi:MAG: AI-2E family transporter [Chloroflexi bacterium]|nr:AI-2E family transporter [Chloroflexota bacterium]
MNRSWSLSFRYLMGLLLLAAFVAFLFYAGEALKPIVISGFIAYLVNPAVMLLTRSAKLKRRTAVNLIYFTSIALLIAIPATIMPLFYNELKGVAQDVLSLTERAQLVLAQPVVFGGMIFDLRQLSTGLDHFRSAFTAPVPADAFQLIESTSRGLIWFLVIIVLVYLFMSEWQKIRNWLLELAPDAYREEINFLYARIRGVWMAYLRGQLLLMLIVGVVFTLAWSIIGIPGALVLGVVAGMFTLVPDVGPALAVALAMGVTLLEGSKWIPLANEWVTLIVFVVYLVLINIKNLWLRPFIMGRSVNMNEGLIFIAILTATVLSGILGALLVVPVLASGIIIVSYLIQKVLGKTQLADQTFTFQGKSVEKRAFKKPRHLKKNNRN